MNAALDWLTKAGKALHTAVGRAPENALDRRALQEVETALQRLRG